MLTDCVKSFKGGGPKKAVDRKETDQGVTQRCLTQRLRSGSMRGHSAACHPQNEGVIRCQGKKKKAEREKKGF